MTSYSAVFVAVLTWISVYWFARAGPAASVRIYYETTAAGDRTHMRWSPVPCGLSLFPGELTLAPKTCVLSFISRGRS